MAARAGQYFVGSAASPLIMSSGGKANGLSTPLIHCSILCEGSAQEAMTSQYTTREPLAPRWVSHSHMGWGGEQSERELEMLKIMSQTLN